ncbi:hypothetical protein H5410_026598 [Solanum commersonii]|uniref:Uncharacterized protein n=1 Tax=Solanum commersonii TaxID=4109 RepID=A0A9J5YXH4_SOLCO|nr:hypothetical protein H5410_026598 [Solanum commersonii]
MDDWDKWWLDDGYPLENDEQEALNIYLKQIIDLLDKNNLTLMELELILPEQRAKIMELQAKKEYKSVNVVNNATLKLRHLGPHSKYFSTLCLDDDMKSESSELMEECIDEEQGPYILKFSSPRRQKDIPHIRAKKCKMRHLLLGSFIFIPLPLEQKKMMQS